MRTDGRTDFNRRSAGNGSDSKTEHKSIRFVAPCYHVIARIRLIATSLCAGNKCRIICIYFKFPQFKYNIHWQELTLQCLRSYRLSSSSVSKVCYSSGRGHQFTGCLQVLCPRCVTVQGVVTSLSLQAHQFNVRRIHLRFVVEKMAYWDRLYSMRFICFLLIIPATLHTNTSPGCEEWALQRPPIHTETHSPPQESCDLQMTVQPEVPSLTLWRRNFLLNFSTFCI